MCSLAPDVLPLPVAVGTPVPCGGVKPAVPPLSRRTFLALSGATLLAACGGSSTSSTTSGPSSPWVLVQRWPSTSLTPGRVRIPLSLADAGGGMLPSGPDQLRGRMIDTVTGDVVVDELVAPRHGDDLPAPYWPFRIELEEGIYQLLIEGGSPDGVFVQVRDASQYPVPRAGQPLPPFDTPTVDDARGVEPICTAQDGPCALHTKTLTEALATGTPVAYLVGTPAFCQTGTCAPALDSLLEVHGRLGDAVAMVHAEVYTDTTATTVAPALTAYGMDFEPALFVSDASGTLVERLDAVFDTAEIEEALRLAGARV